jgi:hypothetical protein
VYATTFAVTARAGSKTIGGFNSGGRLKRALETNAQDVVSRNALIGANEMMFSSAQSARFLGSTSASA